MGIVLLLAVGFALFLFFSVSVLSPQLQYREWIKSDGNFITKPQEDHGGPYRKSLSFVTEYKKPKNIISRIACKHKIKLRDCVGWTQSTESYPARFVFDSICVKCGERDPRFLTENQNRALSFEFVEDAEKYYSTNNRGKNKEPRRATMRRASKR